MRSSEANLSVPVLQRSYITRGLAAALAWAVCAGAVAQQHNVLEEVTVTAQKREENVQDVGIAITAFTGDQMRALGVEKSFDVAAFTPGVHISGNLAGQNTQFSIRGVTQNDFNDVIEAPNAVYLDEGYLAIAQAQTFTVFDIDRVEVLKGPQGTLFGRNATGGLVQYISRKPEFDRTEGYADVTYGLFDDSGADANQVRVEAALGGPLSDQFAARAAIMYNQQDPYLKNIYPYGAVGAATFGAGASNSPGAGAGANMGDDDTIAGRGTLRFKPNEDLNILMSFNYGRSKVATGPYQSKATVGVLDANGELVNVIDASPTETRATIAANGTDGGSDQGNTGTLGFPFGRPVPGGDFFGYIDPDGKGWTTSGDFAFKNQGHTKTWGLNGRIEWDLENGMNLTSVTDYKEYDKLLFIDVDSAPVNQLANYAGVDASSLTQELRLNGSTDNMRWVAGFFYLNIDTDSDNGLKAPVNSLPALFGFGGLPVDIGVDARLKTDSYSLYGQVERDLTDELTFIVGARVIQEEKDYWMNQTFYISTDNFHVNNGPALFNARAAPFVDSTSNTLWAGKVQLDWRPMDDLLLYAGVNRGVKAGSFNAPIPGGLGFPDSILPYGEEVLLSYEGGFKRTLFNGTTRLNGSIFYYDYSDYQAFLFTGVAGVVVNADANNVGAEMELQTSPIDGLDALLSFSWFDATVENVPLRINSPNPPRDVNPTYAPEFQATGLLRYQWPMFNGNMAVQGDFSYSDSYYYNLRNFDADKFDSYVLVNARLGWTSQDEHWEASFQVHNLTDAKAGIQGFDLATLCGCNEISFRPPRWYGFSLRYNYF